MVTSKKIKKYLKEKGIKQTTIAKKTQIPINIFSNMINGKRKITIEEYSKICNALEVNFAFFAPAEIQKQANTEGGGADPPPKR